MTSQPSTAPAACRPEEMHCLSPDLCVAARGCLSGAANQDRISAVLRSLQRMRDDPCRRHSLTELAQAALLSPFYFHRVFRRITNTTPSRFLTALRMVEAKRLLVDTDLNVIEVCDTVGYSSLGTFTTQFARHVGLSPSRYRHAVSLYGDAPMRDVLGRFAVSQAGPGRPVRGVLTGGPGRPAVAAIGMFDSGIPQGQPVVATVLPVPGVARIFGLPDGDYFALAMCLDDRGSVLAALQDAGGPTGYVGASHDQVTVVDGEVGRPFEIELRHPQAVDPPIVFAAPLILAIMAYGDQRRSTPDLP